MKRDVKPRDERGRPHGYWEVYYYGNVLMRKGCYIHGRRYGYWELHGIYGKLISKGNWFHDIKLYQTNSGKIIL